MVNCLWESNVGTHRRAVRPARIKMGYQILGRAWAHWVNGPPISVSPRVFPHLGP